MNENVDSDDYWVGDYLGRKKQSKYIKSFLDQQYKYQCENNDDPCTYTINIDARWGFGKSFFLKRWKADLEDDGYWVIYYNAWANDYAMDPLSSLIVEISEQLEDLMSKPTLRSGRWENYKENLKKFLNSWSVRDYIKVGATTASAVLACPIIVPDSVFSSTDAFGKELANSVGSAVSTLPDLNKYDALQQERERRDSLKEFKASMGRFTEHLTKLSQKLPLFIFVDELDRCKPDFTIGLIECVKHILSIDHIYFVFATDGGQLQSAIRGLYGDRFDAELYFKRVFDRDITLSQPDNRNYVNALCSRFGYDELHDQSFNEKFTGPDEGFISNTAKCFFSISELFNLSLRDQEQAFSILDSIIKARSSDNEKVNVVFVSFLVVLWLKKKDAFYNFKNNPRSFVVDDVRGIEGFNPEAKIDIGYFDSRSFRDHKEKTLVWDLCNFHIGFVAKAGPEFRESLFGEYNAKSSLFIRFIAEEYDIPKVSSYVLNPMLKYFNEVSMVG